MRSILFVILLILPSAIFAQCPNWSIEVKPFTCTSSGGLFIKKKNIDATLTDFKFEITGPGTNLNTGDTIVKGRQKGTYTIVASAKCEGATVTLPPVTAEIHEFVYTPPLIDNNLSVGFICKGVSILEGRIFATMSSSGSKPYTFNLMVRNNIIETIVTDEDEVLFKGLTKESQYSVFVIDACSTPSVIQTFTIKDISVLEGAETVQGKTSFCVGENLGLIAKSLPRAKYKWTGPNGFYSEDKEPAEITNLTVNDAGTYSVEIESYFCNTSSIYTLDIEVNEVPHFDVEFKKLSGSHVLIIEDAKKDVTYNIYDENNILKKSKTATEDGIFSLVIGRFSENTKIYLEAVIGGCVSPKIPYNLAVMPKGTFFKDNVWFFGNNMSGEKTSKGILFRTRNTEFVPEDFSDISNVDVRANTLTATVPMCGHNFLFYVSHDKVYNTNHEIIGTIEGNGDVADGLASAYIGDNKYVLFSINKLNSEAVPSNIHVYIIDVFANNGKGGITKWGTVPDIDNSSEVLELAPKAKTYNEYWLITYTRDDLYKVYEINDNGSGSVNITLKNSLPSSETGMEVSSLKSNKSFSKLALSKQHYDVEICDFNPFDGSIIFNKYLREIPKDATETIYSTEFSPNDKYLYVATKFNLLVQLNIITEKEIARKSSPLMGESGGIKLGPDNKIYLNTGGSNKIGVIAFPDSANALSNSSLDWDGVSLSSNGGGIGFSTGLTPSWFDPIVGNAPQAKQDYEYTFKEIPVFNRSLLNDVGSNLTLSGVKLLDLADTVKGKIRVAGDSVWFTPNVVYNFSGPEVVKVTYIVLDRENPLSGCNQATINFLVSPIPKIWILDSCSFAPKLTIKNVGRDDYKFQWQILEGIWKDIPSATNIECGIYKSGEYRLVITDVSSGMSFYTYTNNINVLVEINDLGHKTWYKVTEK